MEREQKAFDSVRKSLEKEERKARKVAMMRRKRHIVLAMVLINGASGLFKILSLLQCQCECPGEQSEFWNPTAGAEAAL